MLRAGRQIFEQKEPQRNSFTESCTAVEGLSSCKA